MTRTIEAVAEGGHSPPPGLSEVPAPDITRSLGPMPAVPDGEFDGLQVRADRRLERYLRRAAYRRRWWYPVMLLMIPLVLFWSLLRLDQWVADTLVWPTQGAQFVQVTSTVTDFRPDTRRLTVVIGGLNRKSGTSIADVLVSLRQSDTTVVSLVYGSGIADEDVIAKFDQLIRREHPDVVDFYGSSMGGDVAMNLAAHLARLPARPGSPGGYYPPRVGIIFLDCSPLGTTDVRESGRTQADTLTAITEALHTDGGVGARVAVEVLAQRRQWSDGLLPLRDFRWHDFTYKVREVFQDKVFRPGISTGLVVDQYGVIRRFSPDHVFEALSADTRIVYLRPFDPGGDATVDVAAVQDRLYEAFAKYGWKLSVRMIIDGHHASAERNADAYNLAIRGEYADAAEGT